MRQAPQKPDIARGEDGRLYDREARGLLEALMGREPARRLEALAAMRWLMKSTHHFMERWVEQYGLSEGRLQTMFRLYHHGDMPLGELAHRMRVSPRNVTGLIDHLERDHLVVRVPDPADRRSVRASLTEHGRHVIEGLWKESLQRSLELLADLSQEELDGVRHACLHLVERIEARGGEQPPASVVEGEAP